MITAQWRPQNVRHADEKSRCFGEFENDFQLRSGPASETSSGRTDTVALRMKIPTSSTRQMSSREGHHPFAFIIFRPLTSYKKDKSRVKHGRL